jgi:predicted nucleotidyltransferase/DNA-binding XRE family transcriptional regulator
MGLKELRKEYGLSVQKASELVGVPLRSYIRYENDEDHGDPLKRETMIRRLNAQCEITETQGLLTTEKISEIVSKVISEDYKEEVAFCYLFGSNAKGYAKGDSDVDLCVSTTLKGMRFMGLCEKLRVALHKRVDVLRFGDMSENMSVLHEIMKDGIKIYKQPNPPEK